MPKTRATATWVDPAGNAKTFDYTGRGEPTHCVIDTANDGEFVGWTKDPAQYMRRREADHGEMVALDLVYGDAELAATPEDTAARDEYGYAGTEAAHEVDRGIDGATPEAVYEYKGGPAPEGALEQMAHYVEGMADHGHHAEAVISSDMNSWDVYFSRTSTVDLVAKMSQTAQYSVTAATEQAKANFRADLERLRAEFERRKAAGQVTDAELGIDVGIADIYHSLQDPVPHVTESFVPNTEVATVIGGHEPVTPYMVRFEQPETTGPFMHGTLPGGDTLVQHTPTSAPVVEPAEPIQHMPDGSVFNPVPEAKPKRKSRAKKPAKAAPVVTIDVSIERGVHRSYPQPMSTYPLADQSIPNHYTPDSLGDPMTCTENHNHPDPVPTQADVDAASDSARAQLDEVAAVVGRYATRTLTVPELQYASLARGEIHRALYLLRQVYVVPSLPDAMWLAQLAKAVAVDAFDHAAHVTQLIDGTA